MDSNTFKKMSPVAYKFICSNYGINPTNILETTSEDSDEDFLPSLDDILKQGSSKTNPTYTVPVSSNANACMLDQIKQLLSDFTKDIKAEMVSNRANSKMKECDMS